MNIRHEPAAKGYHHGPACQRDGSHASKAAFLQLLILYLQDLTCCDDWSDSAAHARLRIVVLLFLIIASDHWKCGVAELLGGV